MSVIAFSPRIGPVQLQCVISEDHSSSIEITSNPIETGAEVNDHAYIKPKEVILDVADSNAALTYNLLITFQESRIPFYLVTGLKLYKDMLIESIDTYRDKDEHSILRATVRLREVIIVSTATAPSVNEGGVKAKPGGKKSIKSVTPDKELAVDTTTKDRVAETTIRGDTPSKAVETTKSQSLAKSLFQ